MSDCIFCKIIEGEIPGKFVYKDNDIVAFHDISPKAPIHILVAPKIHLGSLIDVTNEHERLLGKIMLCINKIAGDLGVDKSGYKIVINNGEGAGQIVPHLHVHLLGGWKRKEEWKV